MAASATRLSSPRQRLEELARLRRSSCRAGRRRARPPHARAPCARCPRETRSCAAPPGRPPRRASASAASRCVSGASPVASRPTGASPSPCHGCCRAPRSPCAAARARPTRAASPGAAPPPGAELAEVLGGQQPDLDVLVTQGRHQHVNGTRIQDRAHGGQGGQATSEVLSSRSVSSGTAPAESRDRAERCDDLLRLDAACASLRPPRAAVAPCVPQVTEHAHRSGGVQTSMVPVDILGERLYRRRAHGLQRLAGRRTRSASFDSAFTSSRDRPLVANLPSECAISERGWSEPRFSSGSKSSTASVARSCPKAPAASTFTSSIG